MCVADWTDWVAAPIYPGKQTVTKIYRDFTGSQSAMPAKQSGEQDVNSSNGPAAKLLRWSVWKIP